MNLNQLFETHKESQLFGRYITNGMIRPLVKELHSDAIQTSVLGYSVEQRPIFKVSLGHGKQRILIWSQMHGNESTTTKALFDLLNVFSATSDLDYILDQCTLLIIPILNPDGAERYSRFNANNVDLNRDAQALSQPESWILRSVFDEFKPNFCFNLHGQRTIFGAGVSGKPATLSFLTPAEDQQRSVTASRRISMALIAEMFKVLLEDLPDAIGRYDDSFNINCVGDTFQSFGVPTILFEAGHFKQDYDREATRYFMFKSFVVALAAITRGIDTNAYGLYFEILENKKNFFDIIVRNIVMKDKSIQDIAIQYREELKNKKISFIPEVVKTGNLLEYFSHKEMDAKRDLASTFANALYSKSPVLGVVLKEL